VQFVANVKKCRVLNSSYSDYIGMRNGTLPQTTFILSQFASREAYGNFVEEAHEPKDLAFEQKLALYSVFE